MKVASTLAVAMLAASSIAVPFPQESAPQVTAAEVAAPQESKTTTDVDRLPETSHSLESKEEKNPPLKWYKPWTWFVPAADDKIEQGAIYVAEGVIGGAIGAIGFKVGEEIWKDIVHEKIA